MEHIICIGSSAASIACATQLRRLDRDIRITILTAQAEKPHNICLLADYVAKKRTKESLYVPLPADVSSMYNAEVVTLDAVAKRVVTRNGGTYYYDKLFIGTGLKPHIPEFFVPYLYTRVFPFKSLDDIVAFETFVGFGAKNILIVGGGVTGIEAAYAFHLRGYRVTLAEKNARLLPAGDEQIAHTIHELLQAHGVTVCVNYPLRSDILHEFDTIFLATGGKPSTNFVHNQIILDNGFIVVDDRQQTSASDIFAGGDVCVGRSLWRQALRDGMIAAYGLLSYDPPSFKLMVHKTVIHLWGKSFIA